MTKSFVASLLLFGWVGTAAAEGSDDVGVEQKLQPTVMRADIRSPGESIHWQGDGPLMVTPPGGTGTAVDNGGVFVATVAGPHELSTIVPQTGPWDILVTGTATGMGRVSSLRWNWNSGDYSEKMSNNASFYALVSGGSPDHSGVVELSFAGLAGYNYSVSGNGSGMLGLHGASGFTGGIFNPSTPLYLRPPEFATHTFLTPEATNLRFESGSGCFDRFVSGEGQGRFAFESNVQGTFHILCDTDQDGAFNRTSSADLQLIGDAQPGTNLIKWNGKTNGKSTIAPGNYDCRIELAVGEFHYIAQDIETSYNGLRMFAVDAAQQRSSLAMYWNDALVQSKEVAMPSGEPGLQASGPDGLSSGNYEDAPLANGNARAWGNFSALSKGDETMLDTHVRLGFATSALHSLESVEPVDCDADGFTDFYEGCTSGTLICDADSDNDQTCDGPVAVTGVCTIRDKAPQNPNVCADTDFDLCDDCTNGTLNTLNDGLDSDADTACDLGDWDDDNDYMYDDQDPAPLDKFVCGDWDIDTCDDCSVAGMYTWPLNDGPDLDLDGLCDAGDPDDDGDGILDTDEVPETPPETPPTP